MDSNTNGEKSAYDYLTEEWAIEQDSFDALREFRLKFHIPTLNDLKSPTLSQSTEIDTSSPSTYLCGNSLGLQPKQTTEYVNNYLTQWRRKVVLGHFVGHADSLLPPFLHIDDHAAKLIAPIVGAQEHEVAVMGTLTGNLHLLMSSFYQPDRTRQGRYKIMLEGKAFPSDHFAVESQVVNHGLDPKDAMVLLEPEDASCPILNTEQILKAIDRHADQLALLLLPGIQFYTGQYFDMKTITAHAQSRGITVGWDCAHAVGNVDLQLHDWNVDFAVWCSYKYLNTGPGGMAGIFVHDKYGVVSMDEESPKYRPRLSGWWGDDKKTRFQMTNKFMPQAGAAGYQVSNPSGIDLAAVVASLQIFNQTSMTELRKRSMRLTKYLEDLLNSPQIAGQDKAYSIITPQDPLARGAQLSIRLKPGLLESVLEVLEENGVVIDERKPDVIRVAPAPLYNTFEDVWTFCKVFRQGLDHAQSKHR